MAEYLDDLEDLAVLALLLNEKEGFTIYGKRTEGEFAILHKELINHKAIFF